MFFVLFATDRPDSFALRASLKERHKAHLDGGAPELSVLQSGPTLDRQGRENGSVIVLRAPSLEHVESFLSDDPYVKGALFETVVIRQWHWYRGNPHI